MGALHEEIALFQVKQVVVDEDKSEDGREERERERLHVTQGGGVNSIPSDKVLSRASYFSNRR